MRKINIESKLLFELVLGLVNILVVNNLRLDMRV